MKLSDLKSTKDGIYELKQGGGQNRPEGRDITITRIDYTRIYSNSTEENFS